MCVLFVIRELKENETRKINRFQFLIETYFIWLVMMEVQC